jgi:methionyl-tRNA formyltransferase
MRLVFMATGEIALPAFRSLLANGPRPLALVTQPDKPVGRHRTPVPPVIKTEALAAGIPVLQPERVGHALPELAALEPDVIVVMAYGQILGKSIIRLPRLAIINLHASLLPKYRGAACIQAAIDAGDTESGLTAMHVISALDAGDIILKKPIDLAPDETGGSLHDRLARLAPDVLAAALTMLMRAPETRVPQDESAASHVPKLEREDGLLDWNADAVALERRIRAYDPWPGTFTRVVEEGRERRLKIFPPTEILDSDLLAGEISIDADGAVIGCGNGALRILWVQPEGGRRMSIAEYLRGRTPQSVH